MPCFSGTDRLLTCLEQNLIAVLPLNIHRPYDNIQQKVYTVQKIHMLHVTIHTTLNIEKQLLKDANKTKPKLELLHNGEQIKSNRVQTKPYQLQPANLIAVLLFTAQRTQQHTATLTQPHSHSHTHTATLVTHSHTHTATHTHNQTLTQPHGTRHTDSHSHTYNQTLTQPHLYTKTLAIANQTTLNNGKLRE